MGCSATGGGREGNAANGEAPGGRADVLLQGRRIPLEEGRDTSGAECVCVCVHGLCAHMCTCVRTRVCMCMSCVVCACAHVCLCAWMRVCTSVCACVSSRVCARVCAWRLYADVGACMCELLLCVHRHLSFVVTLVCLCSQTCLR